MQGKMQAQTALLSMLALSVGCAFLTGGATPEAAPTVRITVSESASSSPATPAPTATVESAVIHWWHYTADARQKQILQEAARDFTQTHPSVTIEITVLESGELRTRIIQTFQLDEAPDLIQNSGNYFFRTLAAGGYLQDITDAMAGEWGDTFLPAARGLFEHGGRSYGVPQNFSLVGVWYNKALFRRAGIDAPPAKWSDFLSDIRKLQTAGIIPIALGERDEWSGAFWWEFLALRLGGPAAFEELLGGKTGFTASPFLTAGERLAELVSTHPFQSNFLKMSTYPDASDVFGNRIAAMHLMGDWESINHEAASNNGHGLGADLGWFPFPAVDGGEDDPADFLGGGNGWLVGKYAPPAAIEFLKYLTGKKVECLLNAPGAMPAVFAAGDCLADPFPKTVWQAAGDAGYLQSYYDIFLPPAIGLAVDDAVRGLFDGSKSPAEVGGILDDALVSEPLT